MNAKLLALITVLGLTGCKMTDNLDEMHSSTMDMSSTTKEMKDTTLKMESGTQAMYHQMRSKEAQETRTRSLRGLLEAQTFEEKLTHAVPYFQGFEFQLWTGGKTDIDNSHFREELLAVGADEFFRAVQSLMSDLDARSLSPSSEDNDALSAFALAVTLHETHLSQNTRPIVFLLRRFLLSTRSLDFVTTQEPTLKKFAEGFQVIKGLEDTSFTQALVTVGAVFQKM